ncbi:hypothetical protein NSU_3447 [Novosphingobium pentaromativorans US6-1]|uniref:Rieske domain-containing protein n=1 Tax=Novosphingobium pentaromativorans US6-1 TaxID=1088721 RepID=G6EGL7_9SPHN|nr:hypothetical protein NSU_3447 [Novosphingobium pentaromativorans US6-1]
MMEDRCCHRFAPLSKGRIEDGCNLRCMYHGMKFDQDGACIEIPCQDTIPESARVRVYPSVERGGWLWVWMGDAAAADPDLIPPVVGLDDPDWVLKPGQLDYEANYELINDNLTDLTHLGYVHNNSFGATEEWARILPTVRRTERGIRVTRWIPAGRGLSMKEDGEKGLADYVGLDWAQWNNSDYYAAGVLLLTSAMYRPEDMPADGKSQPTAQPVNASFSNHILTPIDERHTRYFFSFGPRAVDGDEQMALGLVEVAKMAFNEDRVMIEAQQKIIDKGAPNEVIIKADVGPVQMRSVIRKLIKAEGGETRAADAFTTEPGAETMPA